MDMAALSTYSIYCNNCNEVNLSGTEALTGNYFYGDSFSQNIARKVSRIRATGCSPSKNDQFPWRLLVLH